MSALRFRCKGLEELTVGSILADSGGDNHCGLVLGRRRWWCDVGVGWLGGVSWVHWVGDGAGAVCT